MSINDDAALGSKADVMGAKTLQMTRSDQVATNSTTSLQRRKIEIPSSLAPTNRINNNNLHALQNRTDDSRPGNRVDIQRRGQPVQRVLNHNNAILAADIAIVSELKRGSVYRLEFVNKDRLIIKIENFRQNEGLGAFVARQEENSAMAAQVLQGVPGINRLTLADIGVLTALPANTPGGGIAGLQNALAAMGQFPMSAVKAQNVNAGTSLGKVFNPRRVQGQWTEAFAPAPYLQNLQTAQAQKQLGEMAAFDLLVSNADRFSPDGTVNLDNLDFANLCTPIGIDNVDPNSDLTANWNGGKWLSDVGQMAAYAILAVDYLCKRTGLNPETFVIPRFIVGMQNTLRILKNGRTVMWQRSVFDPDNDKRNVLAEFVRRLDATHP